MGYADTAFLADADDFFSRLVHLCPDPAGLSSRGNISPEFSYVLEFYEEEDEGPLENEPSMETDISVIMAEIMSLEAELKDDPDDDETPSLKKEHGKAVSALRTVTSSVSRPPTRSRSIKSRLVRKATFA